MGKPSNDDNNYRKINIKKKRFVRGKNTFSKSISKTRYKKTPKYIKNNPENKIAKLVEKDVYHFAESDDDGDDLGMGIDISDLPFLDDNHSDKQIELIALAQDAVRPLFTSESYDESKLLEGLAELHYSSFRPNQKETIKRILMGRSTLFISPTGSGKSLCYQLPALLYWRHRKYMTIVVSPLISLMEDQLKNSPSSLKAVSLHSGHTKVQRRKSIEQLVNGEAQVVFISPEAIVGGLLELEDLKNLPPVGFVCVDEAHCLSELSHNFRPAYLQFFRILSEQMSIKTYLGLTATATRAISFAVARNLTINPDTDVIGKTTIPQNLILSVSVECNKEKALLDLLKSPTFRIMTSIIIYCNRRDETEALAGTIRAALQNYSTLVEVPERSRPSSNNNDSNKSISSNSSDSPEKAHMKLAWHAEAYHAGLSLETKKRIQRQFIKGEIRVIVATIAFGMGINKSNVRAIIHYDMPSSFESYVQEIGRAGRDGKPAQCHMFLSANKTDLFYQQRNIYSSVTEPKRLRQLTDYLTKKCMCRRIARPEELEKIDRLNEKDQHTIISDHKTDFTNTPIEVDKDEEEDYVYLDGDDNEGAGDKENHPVRFMRDSLLKKHRICDGHEISFSVQEATQTINLSLETIITLICQLQKAYPQLKIKQFPPARATCDLFCYKGPEQLKKLAETSSPVEKALTHYKLEQRRLTGQEVELPNRITFDTVAIASMMGKTYSDVVKMLKKTEWELVEKTGRFRKSQVRVNFEGCSFHLRIVGDLDEKEKQEINSFLLDYNRIYEKSERERMKKVFLTFQAHSIKVEQMKDKKIRLDASSKLRHVLNAYFDSPPEKQVLLFRDFHTELNNEDVTSNLNEKNRDNLISEAKIMAAKKSAKDFIAAHGEDFTPRTIARIFQGVSTPNYPSEHWGMNRKWWRTHLDMDFLQLTSIIQDELLK